jgi:arginase family enzyme
MWPAAGTRWGRQCWKRPCRSTPDRRRGCRSSSATGAWRRWTESRRRVLWSRAALEVIRRHSPARIVTLGGECSVSVAPFSELAARYGEELAVLWVDSHPDIGTPASAYPGYHAMAVAALTGHGDPDVLALLPATVAPERVALVGLHSWEEDDYPNIAQWGIR